MKAALYHGVRDICVETVSDPTIKAPQMRSYGSSTPLICGSDLWPYPGVAKWQAGSRIGHEFIGVVEESGAAVTAFKAEPIVAALYSYNGRKISAASPQALFMVT
jgi:threonine dehydrogenase-like Zn-dependent dehydrogenase